MSKNKPTIHDVHMGCQWDDAPDAGIERIRQSIVTVLHLAENKAKGKPNEPIVEHYARSLVAAAQNLIYHLKKSDR